MSVVTRTFSTPTAIPDSNPTGISAVLNVADVHVPTGASNFRIEIQNLNITHPFNGDLDIFLIDPDGNQITLSTDNGGGGDNYTAVTLSDLSPNTLPEGVVNLTGTFHPEQSFASLLSGAVNGNWTLKIVDDTAADVGTLQSFTLAFLWDDTGVVAGTLLDDTLNGSDLGETIFGFSGKDTISGLDGADILVGGVGKDTLTGGLGGDSFDFDLIAQSGRKSTTRDVITDFTKGSDHIDLRTIDANELKAGNQAFKFIGTQPFHRVPGELSFHKFNAAGTVNDKTVISVDVTGDGRVDMQIELTGLHNLAKGDFFL